MSDHEQAATLSDEWRPSDTVDAEPAMQPLSDSDAPDTPASSILPVAEEDVADAPTEGSPAMGVAQDPEWRPSSE